jgi:hypothetical protein
VRIDLQIRAHLARQVAANLLLARSVYKAGAKRFEGIAAAAKQLLARRGALL